MGKLIYTNNFPREKAEKGQEFKGNSDLKEELLERGIIEDGEVTKEAVDTSELEGKVTELEGEKSTLEEKVTELEGKVTELETAQAEIVRLNGLVKEAIGLAKGTAPEGFEG